MHTKTRKCQERSHRWVSMDATKHRIGYIGHIGYIGIKLYLHAVLGVEESSNCYVYVSTEHSKKYI